MSYLYCKCGAGLDAPTLREVVEDTYTCPSCDNPVVHLVTEEETLVMLLDAIEALQESIKTEPNEVRVTLTKEQCSWLHGLMQNPIPHPLNLSESFEDTKMRTALFELTK
jgi:hypothetical protein